MLPASVVTRAQDPRSTDTTFLLDTIGGFRTPQAASVLTGVAADPAAPEELRLRARYLHEEWFGAKVVGLSVAPVGPYGSGHPLPVFVDVTITNTTPAPIRFEYTSPTELLSVYLTRSQGREMTFLPPRRGVSFFTPPAASPAKRVILAPGQVHTIRLGIANYVDLSAGGDHVVWVSAKLPGQAIAQLTGGSGINPR